MNIFTEKINVFNDNALRDRDKRDADLRDQLDPRVDTENVVDDTDYYKNQTADVDRD